MDTRTEELIRLAMEEAVVAARAGNRPFGAIIVDRQRSVLIAEHNRTIEQSDPTAHAEMTAIRELCRTRQTLSLAGLSLYTNAQPCPMCFAAMVEVRLAQIYFAAPSTPGVWPSIGIERLAESFPHRIAVHGGILKAEASAQIARLSADAGRAE